MIFRFFQMFKLRLCFLIGMVACSRQVASGLCNTRWIAHIVTIDDCASAIGTAVASAIRIGIVDGKDCTQRMITL